MTVAYKGTVLGEYFADLLIEDSILIELKTVRALDRAHRAQCINYLRAVGKELCLMTNFGAPRVEIQPVVQDLGSTRRYCPSPARFVFICVHLCPSA